MAQTQPNDPVAANVQEILQQPELTDRAVAWIEENRTAIFGSFAALAVAGLVVVGYENMQASRDRGATAGFLDGMKAVQAEVVDTLTQDRKETETGGLEFKSEEVKGKAVVDEFTKVREANPSLPIAKLAALYIANAWFDLGDYDKAIENYQVYLSAPEKVAALEAPALESMGFAYEAKSQWERALDAYRQLEKVDGLKTVYSDIALYHQARMLHRMGKADEAKPLLKRVLDEYPDSAVKNFAKERLALIDAGASIEIPDDFGRLKPAGSAEPAKPAEGEKQGG